MSCIYIVENKYNGHQYIGKTKFTAVQRWQSHQYDIFRYKTKFYNAVRKYGIDSFFVYEMEQCSFNNLDEREKYWIGVLEPEYNTQPGGTGGGSGKIGRRWKIKNTSNMKKSKTVTTAVIEGRKLFSGANNYQSVYIIHTPVGTFDTWFNAKKALNMDIGTIQRYSLQNILVPNGRRTRKEWRNKMSREIGFFVEKKDENKSS